MYDNKGPEKRHFGGSNDVDENKGETYVKPPNCTDFDENKEDKSE